MCRAVLPDGKTVCETTNFDDANACTNCGAPRQATDLHPEPHDPELGTVLLSGAKSVSEKARQYAPVAAAVAETAKAKASNIAMHSRLATRTGVHPFSVLLFSLILLVASAALPVALGWPMTLTVGVRNDIHNGVEALSPASQHQQELPGSAGSGVASSNPGSQQQQQQEFQGSISEQRHIYKGSERVVDFVPKQLTDPRKGQVLMAAIFSGPVLISGTAIQLNGTGQSSEGGISKGSVSLDLGNGSIFWFSALALLLLLLITDLLIGDIYAMQKMLIGLLLVWITYCVLLSSFAQTFMKSLMTQLFPDVQMELHMTGLMTAPIKIGFIGLIYWMSSMILRSLHQERKEAAAERRRMATEVD